MTLWHGEQGSTSDNSPEHGRMAVQVKAHVGSKMAKKVGKALIAPPGRSIKINHMGKLVQGMPQPAAPSTARFMRLPIVAPRGCAAGRMLLYRRAACWATATSGMWVKQAGDGPETFPMMTLWHDKQGSTSDNSPEHGRMVVQQVRQMTAFSRHLRLLLANPIRL